MKLFTPYLTLVLSLGVVSSASAQRQSFAVNPDASEVKMTLKTNHDIVHGNFHVQAGSIDFDHTASKISGSVVVAAGSCKTGNDSRDKKMNKDILNIDKYTTVSFEPKSYTGAIAPSGDSTIQVTGVFTLLGTPHDLTIPMQIHIEGGTATAKAHMAIPYVQWGLKDPSFMMWKAEKQVDIDLTLVGHVA